MEQQMAAPFSKEGEETLAQLAFQSYQVGDYSKAMPLYRLLTVQERDNSRYWLGLAASLQMMQRYDEALSAYGYLALLEPNNPMLYYHSAECHFALGTTDVALIALDEAIIKAKKDSKHKGFVSQLTELKKCWQTQGEPS